MSNIATVNFVIEFMGSLLREDYENCEKIKKVIQDRFNKNSLERENLDNLKRFTKSYDIDKNISDETIIMLESL